MRALSFRDSGLTRAQYAALKRLRTPAAIQDFLDALPMNCEKGGETLRSPRGVLEAGKAHCFEGALLAAATLWIQGEPPRIMNLSARLGHGDVDHVVALYTRGGRLGAISKTNHATIRFRNPVYRTPRELALSYFHEWFLNSTAKTAKGRSPDPRRGFEGEKTLECFSTPVDLSKKGAWWVASAEDLWQFDDMLANARHHFLVPRGNWHYVRKADAMELKAGRLTEWRKSDPRT